MYIYIHIFQLHISCMLMESAKLHVLRAHVLRCLACLRAHVLTCLACLCAHVPRCLECLRVHVPTCLRCLRNHVSAYLTCSRANVPCMITRGRANVLYVPTCLRTITSNNKNRFSMTFFIQIVGTFSLYFSCEIKLYICI